jgi:hypothetical protein
LFTLIRGRRPGPGSGAGSDRDAKPTRAP